MAHQHEAISNSIFESYRIQERVKEQKKAIKLLLSQGYTIFDLQGQMLHKSEAKIDKEGNLIKNKEIPTSYK